METNQVEICVNCTTILPSIGFFCGGCLTQFKCKSCGSLLEKSNIGCIFCGTPKEEKTNHMSTTVQQGANTFHFHEIITEKATERTVNASFSDNVSKDIADLISNPYSINLNAGFTNTNSVQSKVSDNVEKIANLSEVFQEAEILNNDASTQHTHIDTGNQPPSALTNEYPTLKAIAMKNLPNSEVEWVIVYSFYASSYGKDIFTREDIIHQYIEANRFNKETTKRDLSTNVKRAVIAGYVNPLQAGYSMLDNGIEKAKEIINRTSSSTPKIAKNISKSVKNRKENDGNESEKKEKKKTQSTGKSFKILSDIDFNPVGLDSLKVFYKKFPVKSDNERNLLFVYYLLEHLKVKKIQGDHIYTCYDEIGVRIPENITQSINNTKNRTKWIESVGLSTITITVKGRNKIKFWDNN